MIKLKYTTYVKILVIIVVKNKELIKSLPKEVRFQKALKNPSTPPPPPPLTPRWGYEFACTSEG